MIAYHGDHALKARFVAELDRHRAADMIAAGAYRSADGATFCAVGCSIHSLEPDATEYDDHAAYERLIGVPRMLARLQDGIFEGLPEAERGDFVVAFGRAIEPGADLSLVGWQFLHRIVGDVLAEYGTDAVRAGCRLALDVLAAKARGEDVTGAAAEAAAEAAEAAWAAEAARDAAEAAWAAWAAWDAAEAARVAWAAARAAEAAGAAAWAAGDAARAARSQQAALLLELIAAAPLTKAGAGA